MNLSCTVGLYVKMWFLGSYFWEHIFESTLQPQTEGWSYGEAIVDDITLRCSVYFVRSVFRKNFVFT